MATPPSLAHETTRDRATPWAHKLAILAIVGPIVFGVVTQSLIFLQADFLSTMGDLEDEFPISPNALGPYGAVMIVNFLVVGASVCTLAFTLFATTERRASTVIGIGLLALAGVALMAEAVPMEVFPPQNWWGKTHFYAFFVWAFALLLAYGFLGAGLLRDRRWRAHGWYTIATAVVTLALVFGTSSWATADVVTRHGAWWGPLGRAHFIIWLAWFSVLGFRARRLLQEDRLRWGAGW